MYNYRGVYMNYMKEAPAVLREYLVYLETILGRSHKTVSEYYLDLRTFFRFIIMTRGMIQNNADFDTISIDSIDINVLSSITRTEILDFLVFAANDRPKHYKSPETTYGNTAKTRARKISALRGLYKYYCDKLQVLKDNPTKSLDAPKTQKQLPKFLNYEESIQLLSSIDGRYKERDYCIILLFLTCGLRVSELVGINIGDISDDRLRVLGKGNKERIVYISEACKDAIERYLAVRESPKTGHRNAMFISRLGQRIDEQTVKYMVKKHLLAAGLGNKKLSVHKLRHTAATLMYQNGVDVRTLKEVLGHQNLDTTMIYTHVVDKNLRDAAALNPLSNIKKSNEE